MTVVDAQQLATVAPSGKDVLVEEPTLLSN